MADDFLTKTFVVLAASFAAVGLLTKFRFPPAVGYLLAGLVIGPHGLGVLAASEEILFVK
jgi:monovalent cation:H+ antiporter-2, CPA2 family